MTNCSASCIEKATIELTLNQPKTQLGIMYRLCVLSLICMSLQDTINTTVWIMAAREEVRMWPVRIWLQPLLAFVGFFGLLWSPYFPSELQNEVNMHMCSSSRRPVGMFPQVVLNLSSGWEPTPAPQSSNPWTWYDFQRRCLLDIFSPFPEVLGLDPGP